MEIKVKQFSSLAKLQSVNDITKNNDCYRVTALKGEHFAYQFVLNSNNIVYQAKCEIKSDLEEGIEAYFVDYAVMDYAYPRNADDDYITKENGIMPDILIPLKEKDNIIYVDSLTTIWIDVNIPENCKPGIYTVIFKVKSLTESDYEGFEVFEVMKIRVLDVELPEQKTLYTQWFHTDCIASIHNVEIYSEQHWELIDKYMKMAKDVGMNMILTPIVTPHLNVLKGSSRPNVQLVDINENEDGYTFDFTKLKRWVELTKKNKIEYYEMAPLFTQWGLEYTPNIVVKSKEGTYSKFGWHVSSGDKSYQEFIKAFLTELMKFLEAEGIDKNTYFHLSDEPGKADFEKYKYAYQLVKPLIGDCKIMDACSHYDFFSAGLMDIPVACTNEIKDFLDKDVKSLFAYYCCTGVKGVSNRLMSMPSYRNRIIGIQMYKYNIEGFLHWGYNFYYSKRSEYVVNPFSCSSAGRAYPSGDSFSVYPGTNGPLYSMRALVFKDALQDIELLKLLEKYIGKEEVIKLIEEEAGMEITFTQYPRNNQFIINLTEKIKRIIAEKKNFKLEAIRKERKD